MSFFFGNLVGSMTNKYRSLKTQYKLYEEDKIMHKSNKLYVPPNHIKTNPFYWVDLIKTNLKLSAKKLYTDIKSKPRQLGIDPKNPFHFPTVKVIPKNLAVYSKQASLVVLNAVNELVKKVTFGHVDLKKIYSNSLHPFYKNYYQPILRHLSYQNLLIYYRNVGNNISLLNQKTLVFMNRYRDHKAYEDFRSYYDDYVRKMDQQGRNQNPNNNKFRRTFNKFVPKYFLNMKLMTNNNLHKVNKYVQAPYYKQKFYNYELMLKNLWKNRSNYKHYFSFDHYKDRFNKLNKKNLTAYYQQFSYQNMKSNFTGGVKRKMRKILFYIASFYIAYYSIKYFIHRIFDRRTDKHLEEALKAVRELKTQNEELMKYNRDLMERFNNGRY